MSEPSVRASAKSACARRRIRPNDECPQIFFGQIQHADDVRREHQDHVGLVALILRLWPNRRPTSGRSLTPGMPSSELRSSSRISPASMFVSPSFSRICVVISRLPNVGSPPKPVPEMLVT